MGVYKGYEDLSSKYWSSIKYRAKKRNIKFSLDIKYAWDLFVKQNKKCALSGYDIELFRDSKTYNTASLDRIDSSKGYIKNNVQWLHKDVNNLKGIMDNKTTIDLCKKIFFNNLKENRPDWPTYFINMAYIASTRSRDPSTKCGCVLTDLNYRVKSVGYNGNFQGIDDTEVSWERPDKYFTVIHAEMNALLFCSDVNNLAYAFITSIPCSNCCKHLIQSGITKIYYSNNSRAKMCNKEDEQVVRKLCKYKNVELVNVKI